MFEFLPKAEDRLFDCAKFIGKIATLHLQHLYKDGKQQYVSAQFAGHYASGWTDKLGEPYTTIRRKVIGACVMEHMNGGRSDCREYSSYAEYFNENKKIEVQELWKSGLICRMSRGGGDPDVMSLIVKFKGFELDGSLYDLHAPEEWYSEMYADKSIFQFPRGFYADAEEAITFISDKPSDDLFGERYFPVIVFSKETTVDVRSIADYAKGCSKPIVTDKHIVFGLRCKPHEFSSCINNTYKNGGFVPKAMVWDWD